MTIYFACAHCGKRHKAPDEMAEKMASCARCDRDLLIPRKSTVEVPKPSHHAPQIESASITKAVKHFPGIRWKNRLPLITSTAVKKWAQLIGSFLWKLAIPVLPLVAIASRFTGPSLWWLAGHICLITFVIVMRKPFVKRWPQYKTPILIGAIVAGFSLAWVNQVTATYYDEFDGEYGHHVVTRKRGGVPVYWESYSQDYRDFFRGPVSSSGKQHGEWTGFTDGKFERKWFWYGEEITEGEWHLRSNH